MRLFVSYPGHSLCWVLPLCRDAVSVFYTPSRLSHQPTHVYIYIYIYIYIQYQSPDSLYLSKLSTILDRSFRLHPVFTQLMYISHCLSANTVVSMYRSSQGNIDYELALTSPAVPFMSSLSYLDDLWDERQVAIRLLFCGILFTVFDQNRI